MSDSRKSERQPANKASNKNQRDFLGKGANLDVSWIQDQYPQYKNCVLRFVNNEKGRVQRMQSLGWEVVMIADQSTSGVWNPAKPDDGAAKTTSIVSRVVGSGQTVAELSAILMAKSKDDFASQERAALHQRAKEIELAIGGGQASERAAGIETYNAGSKIRVGD